MTFAELIYQLRIRLIDALDRQDRQECSNLMTTFQMILEASYNFGNRELSEILDDLAYSGQHGAMGVDFKARSAIPTDETMKKVFFSVD
jgi:hypothetical protein